MLLKKLENVVKIKKIHKAFKEFESKLFMKFEKLPTFKILKNQNTLKCMKFGCRNLKILQFL